jgi:hypothetical protein
MPGRARADSIVVDGHPSHHAKMVTQDVRSTQEMLERHFLLRYARTSALTSLSGSSPRETVPPKGISRWMNHAKTG